MQVTIGQAAEMIGVHPSTLRRWSRWGKTPPVARDRNGWRIFTEEDIATLRHLAHSRDTRGAA